jgi:predicted nuclease with RNAse H fold
MNILGIDLAGSEKRPTGIAYLNNQNKIKTKILYLNEEILSIARSFSEIFIDAPISLPHGRKSLEENNGIHFRESEVKIRKLGIKVLPSTLGPMRMLTKRAMYLKDLFEKQNKKVYEVFPAGFYRIMNTPKKMEDIVKLYNDLGYQLEDKIYIQDEIDAIACLITGIMFKQNKAFLIEGIDGSIVLPKNF